MKKMVLIGGPRQCGKTTLAKDILLNFNYKKNHSGLYLNWDYDEDRKTILKKDWYDSDQLLVLDEIHKFHKWKNWLKGLYDKKKDQHNILVTGSSRLNIYKKGGDSMVGRYHYWRLHPFCITEIPKKMTKEEAFKRLMTVGGFPEPFLDGDEREANRWRKERLDLITKDDIRDLKNIKQLQLLKLFLNELRARVSSEIALSNIAEDLQISPVTAKDWLELFEQMYLCFTIRPFSKNVPRSILKSPKVYFYDNGDVISKNEGNIFENFIATHLLKQLHFAEDFSGDEYTLGFIRDKENREVDFAVKRNSTLLALIEVKLSDDKISKSLRHFSEKLKPIRSIQVVSNLKKNYVHNGIEVIDHYELFNSFAKFLAK